MFKILFEIILIGLSLSFDCFAVAISGGSSIKKHRLKNALKIAGFFGIFQALMPLIGLSIGNILKKIIFNFTHWVAFILLLAIGIKMIIESFKKEDQKQKNILNNYTLIILSLATSIDALVVGFSLALLDMPVIISILIIGLLTFLISILGYYIGNKASKILPGKAELVGGLILIGIGIKIIIEHYMEKI